MNLLLCLAILAAVVVIWCTVPALWVLCLRTNYGYKVDFTTWQRAALPVLCIAISALSWKEPDPLPAS